MKKRESFIFYSSFYDAISDLPNDEQLAIYQAICSYSLTKEEPELSGISNTVFKLIRPQIDANWKRFENGSQAKRKRTVSKKKATKKQAISKAEANNNVNVNVNDNVNNNNNGNKDKYFDCVMLSKEEYKKLLEIYSTDEILKSYIGRLNNYKMSNGKKYKSDYHVMIGWVKDRFIEEASASRRNAFNYQPDLVPEDSLYE